MQDLAVDPIAENTVELDLADADATGASGMLTTSQNVLAWGLVGVGALQVAMVGWNGVSRWRQRRRIEQLSAEQRDEYFAQASPTYELAYGRILPAVKETVGTVRDIREQGIRMEGKLDALTQKVTQIHEQGIRIEDNVNTLAVTAKEHFKALLAQYQPVEPEKEPMPQAA